MNDFTFYSPTCFVFGRDKENEAGAYVRRFGGTRVLIHYGGGSAVKSGLVGRVKASLEAAGLPCFELGGVKPNPRSGLVYEGIELCRREKIDFVLALGGGSSIDSAKAIAMGTPYGGDFWDFFSGKAEIKEALSVGTVLTIAAAGSEGSGDAVITLEDGMLKRAASSDLIRPKFSVLNPGLTQTLPAYQTACGITDIMAHLFERYFTNTKEVEATDRVIEGLLQCMIHEGSRAIAEPDNYEVRANIMWAGTLAHNDCCGVGRAQDWASHSIEHELSALYDCAHGAGLAVIFPAWMRYCMSHDVMRFAQLANRVWGCSMDFNCPENTAKAGIEALRNYLASIGMPLHLKDVGGREEDIPAMAQSATRGKTTGNFVKLTPEDVEAIYRLAL